ncbi:MAG: GAF domain-containing protein [Alphaproteobacteria bacterium]|nr:GAF domain-containing protein [Alphaproteobacteria bacterium]
MNADQIKSLGENFNHLPDSLLVFDGEDCLTLWNPAADALFAPLADRMAPGITFQGLLKALVVAGMIDLEGGDPEAWIADRLRRHFGPDGPYDQRLADGRWLRVNERDLADGGTIASFVDITDIAHREVSLRESERLMQRLATIGIALSAEKNLDDLLEMILLEAKAIANADGGTIYLKSEAAPDPRPAGDLDRRAGSDRRHRERRRQDQPPPAGLAERRGGRGRRTRGDRRRPRQRLDFAIVRNDTLNVALGGTTGRGGPFPPIPLFDPASGAPNFTNVATYTAITGNSVNIPDAYDAEGFDFSGTRRFDEMNGYRSTSFLTIPMKSKGDDVIGVLQLINARDRATAVVQPFETRQQRMVESLASQAAVALDNKLLLDAQRKLFEALIKLIATAIDQKSPYTGGHCARVPALTEMLAQAAIRATEGPFKTFDLTEDEQFELHVAGWLHDCGKITTPEYVVDKSTKLETIYDRIHTVDARFEVLKRDAEIAALRHVVAGGDRAALEAELEATLAALDDDRRFLRDANIGGEFLDPAKVERIARIARRRWRGPDGIERDLLSEEEVYNLSISRGTLTTEERQVMNGHMAVTIQMLAQLPFPKGLKRVGEYAGGHHEKMNGTGFPRGLRREQMSIPARMMAIADIFEALTAGDRPYKKAKTLSESMAIMAQMRDADHIDPDLFELFVTADVYLDYARRFLKPEQVDPVDLGKILPRRG